METRKLNKNILFLHIPKTAGLTLETSFKNITKQFKKIKYYRTSGKGINTNFSLKYFNQLKYFKDYNLNYNTNILGGHFVFSEECKAFRLFTLVRNVQDMFISNLYYQYKLVYNFHGMNSDNINIIKKNIGISLEFNDLDFITIKNLINKNYLNSNIITKTIAGIPYEKFFYVLKDYKISEIEFKKAINNLKYFTYIGQSEKFNYFVKILLKHLSINSTTYTSVNISKHDKNFVSRIKSVLKNEINEYNYYDIKLLELIKKKFN